MTNNNILIIAFLFAAYFLFSVILVHVLEKKLPFFKTPLSKYALHPKGVYLTLGFILIGFNEIIIACFLKFNYPASIGLFLAGLGVIIVGLVKTDAINNGSAQQKIHAFGVILQFVCFPIAVLLLTANINAPSIIKIYYLITGLSTFVLGIFILMFHYAYLNNQIKYYGLVQKINILIINLWLIIVPLLKLLP